MNDRLWVAGTLVWLITVLLRLIFLPDLERVLGILVREVQLGSLGIAALLLGWAFLRVRRSPRVAAAGLLVVFSTLAFEFTAGQSWGRRTRFALVRQSYEQRLRDILQSFERGVPVESRPAEFLIEPGPPVRVAFLWQAGVTDNWVGLVYDPTGVVMRANQFHRNGSNWSDPALEPVKRLFGGDLVRASHLKDHWYLCAFT